MKFILPAILLASASLSFGANFSTGFDAPPFNDLLDVAGQEGWTISDPTAELSFFVDYTTPGGTSNAAALGGFYADGAGGAGSTVRLSHAVGNPLIGSTTGVDFSIVPSTLTFPGRDTFGFSFYNGTGTNLLTVQFEPDSVDATLLNITWTTGGSAATATGWAVISDGPYALNVAFADAGGGDASFTASVTGSNVFNFGGALPGISAETIASVGANWTKGAAAGGDNYLIIDNLSAVPEPSTSMVALGALAVGFARRRRK